MVALTNARATWWFILAVGALIAALQLPELAALPLFALSGVFAGRLAGDAFAAGFATRSLTVNQQFLEAHHREVDAELTRAGVESVKETLDEPGQHAADLVLDAIERREGDDV